MSGLILFSRSRHETARRAIVGVSLFAAVFVAGCAQTMQAVPTSVRDGAASLGIPMGTQTSATESPLQAPMKLPTSAGDAQAIAQDRRLARFSEYGIDDNKELKGYLDGLLKKVLQQAKVRDDCCRVEVLENYSLDAYSKASGTIFLTVGWLMAADTEDELVALIAHETAHVVKGHYATDDVVTATTGLRQVYLAGSVVVAAARKTTIVLTYDKSLQYGASVTSRIIHPSLSREQEREADRFAVDVTVASGYRVSKGPVAFLERFATLEDEQIKAMKANAAPTNPTVQALNDFFADLAKKHDTARERLDAAIAYSELAIVAPPPVTSAAPAASPAAGAKTKVTRPVADGWQAFKTKNDIAALLRAYSLASEATVATAEKRYGDASQSIRKIDKKLLFTHLSMFMTQCQLHHETRNVALETYCVDKALEGDSGSWLLYMKKAEWQRLGGNGRGALTSLEAGYGRLGNPPEALPDLIAGSRDVDVKKRDAYNAQCFLTSVALRQACADALTSPEQKKAAADAEAQRLTDKMMKPISKQIDKIGPAGK